MRIPPPFNLRVTVKINNKKFKIPIIKNVGLSNLLMSEIWMTEVIKKMLTGKRGAFVDVGANIGQTLLKLKSVDENIEYLGFEPNKACVSYLAELIKINKFKNVHIYPIGLYNTDKSANLVMSSGKEVDAGATVITNFRAKKNNSNEIIVDLARADNIKSLINISDISVIKIDVEGAELEVLEGAIGIIKKHCPVIIIEILPVYNEKNIFRLERQEKVENIVNMLNYEIFQIEKTPQGNLKNIERIKTIGIHSDLSRCDYILAPIKSMAL